MKKLLARFLSVMTAVVMLVTSMPFPAALAAQTFVGEGDGDDGQLTPAVEQVTIRFEDPYATTVEKKIEKGSGLATSEWPTPATPSGYTFLGWFDGTAQVVALDSIQEDVTLEARYEKLPTHMVTYFDDDQSTVLAAVEVPEGTSFAASEYCANPQRKDANGNVDENYVFLKWEPAQVDNLSGDVSIYAVYKQLQSYTITIKYEFENHTVAADPYVATVREGFSINETRKSPVVLGFIADQEYVTIDELDVSASKEIVVTYSPSDTTLYRVEYYRQDVDGEDYSKVDFGEDDENRTGVTGSMTTVDAADASRHSAPGFTLRTDLTVCNKPIAADGTTVIKLYYDRDMHYVFFDTADGTYMEPLYGLYGSTVNLPTAEPVRNGYTFKGWEPADTQITIGTTDVTVKALWERQTVNYTVVVWRENADDDEYSVLGQLISSGKTGDLVTYKADTLSYKDDKGTNHSIERAVSNGSPTETVSYFTYSPEVTLEKNGNVVPTIKGDGSTIYNVYYTRDRFTIRFYIPDNATTKKVLDEVVLTLQNGTEIKKENVKVCVGQNMADATLLYELTAKYDEYLNGQYPRTMTWTGAKGSYNGWDRINAGSHSTTVTSTRIRMDCNLCNTQTTGSYAHIQGLKVQYASTTYLDQRYYLVERLDGNYEDAGYYEAVSTGSPGQPQSGAATSNKQIMGFTFSGRGVFKITSGDDTFTIFSDPVNKIVTTPEGGLTSSTVLSILRNGTWVKISANAGDKNHKNYVSLWWYTRNKYTLTFKNGLSYEEVKNIPFDQLLADNAGVKELAAKEPTYDAEGNQLPYPTPERPVGVDETYTFAGWYEDAGFAKPVDWTKTTMPAANMIVYAKWQKPVYTVSFDYQSTALTNPDAQEVEKGDTAVTVPDPVWYGHRFERWYYVDENGNEKPFNFSMVITRPYEVLAKWSATSVTYRVEYVQDLGDGTYGDVYDQNHQVIGADEAFGSVDQSVTVSAVEAYDKKDNVLFPYQVSSSIVLTADINDNVIRFVYTNADSVYYLVRYLEEKEDGSTPELASPTGPVETRKAAETVLAKDIPGYTPRQSQITQMLGPDTDPSNISRNLITFYYLKNEESTYTVNYYLQNLDDNQYSLDSSATLNGAVGARVSAPDKTYPGFTRMDALSTLDGYVNSKGSLTLRAFYKRNNVEYTVRYMDKDTGASIHDDTESKARLGKTVTVDALTIEHYNLFGDAQAEIVIDADASRNVYIFQYTRKPETQAADTSVEYSYNGSYHTFVRPVMQDMNGKTLIYDKLEWRYVGDDDSGWREAASMPQYVKANSTLMPGGTAGNVNDYINTPYKVEVRLSKSGYEPVIATASMTIKRIALTITIPTQTFSFDSEEKRLTVNVVGKVGSDTVVYAFVRDQENGWIDATDASGHPVNINRSSLAVADGQGNDVTGCYAISLTGGAIIINPQETATRDTVRTETYNGSPYDFMLPDMLGADGQPLTGVTYQYRLNDTEDWSDSPMQYTNKGSYYMQVRMTKANYKPVETTVALNIILRPITVSAPSGSFHLAINPDGTPYTWTLENNVIDMTSSLVTGHTFGDVQLNGASLATVDTQEVTIAQVKIYNGNVDVTDNYIITLEPGEIEVTASVEEAEIAATGLTETYKAADYTLPQPVVLVKSNDGRTMVPMTDEYSLTYKVTSDAFSGTKTFTNELPHFTDAGVYTVEVKATSRNYKAPDPVTVTMTINQRSLTITGGSVNEATAFIYDETAHTIDPGYAVSIGGLQGDDAITEVTYAENFSNVQIDAIDRAVTPNGVTIKRNNKNVTKNYAVTYADGRMIVKAREVKGGLIFSDVSHVYDGGAHSAVLGDQLVTDLGVNFSLSNTKVNGAPRFTVTYTTAKDPTETATSPEFTDVTAERVTAHVTDVTGNLTIEPITARVEVTKRTVNVQVTSEYNIPYDGAEHTLQSYHVEKADMDGSIARGDTGLVGSDTASAELVNAGPYKIPATYAVTVGNGRITGGNADNYNFSYTPGELQIVPGTGIGLNVVANDAMYDGKEHGYAVTAIVAGNAPYSYEMMNAAGEFVPVQLSEIPAQSQAGDYPLTLRISSPYYAETATASDVLNIDQRPITVTSGNNRNAPFTFNGGEQQVDAVLMAATSPNALAEGDDFSGMTFADGASNAATDVCDRAVTLTSVSLANDQGDVTANYAVTYEDGAIVILRSPAATAEPTTAEATYDGTDKSFTAPVMMDNNTALENVTYEYSLDNVNFVSTMPRYTDVLRDGGNIVRPYTIYVRMSHPNYVSVTTTAELTVLPAAIEVTAGSDTRPYTIDSNGTPITYTVNSAFLSDGTIFENAVLSDLTFLDDSNSRFELGAQNVNLESVKLMAGTVDKTGNYTITLMPGILTVEQSDRDATINASGETVIYDAQNHNIQAPTVAVKDVNGDNVLRTEDFTVTYDVLREGDTDAVSYTKLSDLERMDAGTYHVTIHAASDLYTAPDDVTVDLVIDQRVVNITSADNSAAPYTFTGREQQVDGAATVDNLVARQTLTNLTYADGQSNTATDVVDRAVQLSGVTVMSGRTDVTANYRFNFLPGRIVIDALTVPAASIDVRGVTTVYDGESYGVTLPDTVRTNAGTINTADEFTAEYIYNGVTSAQLPTFIDAGTYPVTVRLTSTSGNYALEDAAATVQINARPLTIAYDDLSVAYDAAEHTVERTITGLVDRDVLTVTDTNRTATNATRLADDTFGALTTTAASYTLTDAADATVNRGANYTVTVTDGSIEVTPLPLTITAGTASYVYNAADQTLTDYTVDGTPVAGQTVNATLMGNTAMNVVDRQAVTVQTAAVTNAAGEDMSRNYDIRTADGSLSITEAPLSLGVTELNVTYDGTAHQPDAYVISGLQGNDRLDGYTLRNMPQTDAGSYNNVSYERNATILRNAAGDDVTANYDITYGTGALNIAQATANYTVAYYYDNVLTNTVTLAGTLGETVNAYPTRTAVGYTFDHVEGMPLTLTADATANVIRVYYTAVVVPELTTLTDAAIPLAGNMASLNVGAGVE